MNDQICASLPLTLFPTEYMCVMSGNSSVHLLMMSSSSLWSWYLKSREATFTTISRSIKTISSNTCSNKCRHFRHGILVWLGIRMNMIFAFSFYILLHLVQISSAAFLGTSSLRLKQLSHISWSSFSSSYYLHYYSSPLYFGAIVAMKVAV